MLLEQVHAIFEDREHTTYSFPEESRSILEEKIENAREAIRRIVERQQELTAAEKNEDVNVKKI